MFGTKKKLRKKTSKKTVVTEVKKEPVNYVGRPPPAIVGEKLLAVLQDWKTQNSIKVHSVDDEDAKTIDDSNEEIRLVFKCVDSNKTGFLQVEEVQRALELLGLLITSQEQEHIERFVDSNNGKLNFKAFQELVAKWQGVTRDFYKELKKGFSMIDHDKDGKISIEDLKEASKFAGINFSRQELEDMLTEADQNGDHAVDINEFIEIMLKTSLF
ncbi:uncharacterized protein O3C94_017382 [Discoglossus pictus]